MKKLEKWLDRQTGTVWFACFLNIAVLAAMLLLLYPAFETNDDISVAMVANGSWGTGNAHIICQNYLLGVWYTALYHIGHGRIPWYGISQYVFLCMAMSVVTYVLFQRLKKEQAYLLNGILLIYFGYECYIRIQFSKTAGVLLAAGAFLLFYELEKEKASWYGILTGIFLGVTGSLYRFKEAAVCCLLIAGIGVYFLLDAGRWGAQKKKKLLIMSGSFGMMGILMLGCEILDRQIYASSPGWAFFTKYNDCRSDLTDYSLPDYETDRALYDELGITETAYGLLKEGLNFYDTDVFSLDHMETLDAARPKNSLSKALVINFLKEYPIGYVGIPVFMGFLIFVFIWVGWGDHRWKVWLTAGYEILVMGMIDFYLYYQGRYLKNRVEVALWFSISLVVIWFCHGRKLQISRRTALVAVACILIANQYTWKNRWGFLNVQKEIDKEYLRGIYQDAKDLDPDGLILAKIPTISYTMYDVLDSVPQGTFENIIWLGGWEMQNPIWIEKLKEYGITNPYRDLINNEHVYLVDDNIKVTLKYIREYYAEDVEAQRLQDNGRWQVYQLKADSLRK